MKKVILLLFVFLSTLSFLIAQDYNWTVSQDGIFRDGNAFFLNGQSWAKKTAITYNEGSNAETQVKSALNSLHNIGVNTIRIYGSPDDSDWDGSSNFSNLIKWIEEWNLENPDNGDPNKAMYYMVQLSPEDPQSSLSDDLPENSAASFNRAIFDVSNDGSVNSLIKTINTITGGSKHLLAYLIYHEFNVSSKYSEWYTSVGAGGIESFMNKVADAIHTSFAPGKLVAHTGDSKDISNGIYKAIEALDETDGNVFASFDMLGFNLYISSDGLVSENQYYKRIVNRRALSVNDSRGWFIGETGASYDKEADPSSVAAANYTNTQGGANLQLMWPKTKELGNMIGFMLFTVQDNDKGDAIGDQMKQRGFFDAYNDKKFLYYIYPDVINEISTNERFHSTTEHNIGVKIMEETDSFNISFEFKNKTNEAKQFLYTVHSDAGSGKQRFSIEEAKEYFTLKAESDTLMVMNFVNKTTNNLLAITSNVIKEEKPFGSYLWGREHILNDAISTIAGLNLNTDNLPLGNFSKKNLQGLIPENKSIRGKFIYNLPYILTIPHGQWKLLIYDLNGRVLFRKNVNGFDKIDLNNMFNRNISGIGIYSLIKL